MGARPRATEYENLYLAMQNGQFGGIFEQWAAALETPGKRVTVTELSGTIEGRAVRVDTDGALVLRLDNGEERRVLAGDVAQFSPLLPGPDRS